MNLGSLLLLFAIMVGAIFGIFLIASKNTATVVDTYGNVAGNETNQSQSLVTNLTATGTQVGGGAVILVGGIIALVVLGALVGVATGKI